MKKTIVYFAFIIHLLVLMFLWIFTPEGLLVSNITAHKFLSFALISGFLGLFFILFQFPFKGRSFWINKTFRLNKLSKMDQMTDVFPFIFVSCYFLFFFLAFVSIGYFNILGNFLIFISKQGFSVEMIGILLFLIISFLFFYFSTVKIGQEIFLFPVTNFNFKNNLKSKFTYKRIVSLGDFGKVSEGGVYNPGILKVDGGYIGLFRLESDTEAYSGNKFFSPCLPFFIKFNKDFKIIDSFILNYPEYEKLTRIEDFRLFRYKNDILVGFAAIEDGQNYFQQHLAKLNLNTRSLDLIKKFKSFRNSDLDNLDLNTKSLEVIQKFELSKRKEEKNWGWFTLEDKIYMLYSVSPWIIYQYDLEKDFFKEIINVDFSFKWDDCNSMLSVSSFPVEYDGNFLVMIHGRTGDMVYMQGVIVFDKKTFKPLHFTQPILYGGKEEGRDWRVLYVTSIVADGENIRIFYGEGDSHTSLLTMKKEEFNNIINKWKI